MTKHTHSTEKFNKLWPSHTLEYYYAIKQKEPNQLIRQNFHKVLLGSNVRCKEQCIVYCKQWQKRITKPQTTVYGYGALGQRTWAICETWGISARRGQRGDEKTGLRWDRMSRGNKIIGVDGRKLDIQGLPWQSGG